MLKPKSTPSMQTRGGVKCIYTGTDNVRVTRPGYSNLTTYVRVQLLPIVPQRIEWVAEHNLKGG